MIFKEQLTRKILYLALLFFFTIGIVVVSFIYENRMKQSFEEKIENQKIREYILLNLQNYFLEYQNHFYGLHDSEQEADVFLKKLNQTYSNLHSCLTTLQQGGTFKTSFSTGIDIPSSLSKKSYVNYTFLNNTKSRKLDSDLNIDFIHSLHQDISNMDLSLSTQNLRQYFQELRENYQSDFFQFNKQLEISRSDAIEQIYNIDTLQQRYLHFYRFFRLILLFAFLLWNFLFFKRTVEKITEIINEILLEKRNFINSILNSLSVGIIVVEVESKKILNINKAALKSIKLAFEDVIDKRYDRFFDADDFQKVTLKDGYQTSPQEITLLNSEKEQITVSKHIIVANLNDKLCYIVNFVDITKQKETEKVLKENEQFNRAIIENSPIGISVRDRYGRLLVGNNAWKKIWNISEERYKKDLEARQEFNFNERDTYMQEHWEQVKRVYMEGGEYYIPALKLKKKQGRNTSWISHHFYALTNESGEVEKVVILSEDISKRKETEDALYERDIRYKTLFEQANDAIFLEDYSGKIIDVNQKACRLSGYKKEELIGMPMNTLQADESIQYLHGYDGLKVDKKIRFQSRLRHKKQFEIPIEKTIAPFADKDDMLFLSIIRDVSEQKKNEFKQSVLFDISNAVNTTKDMQGMYIRLHQLLGKIIDTTNFYIAIYDKKTNLIEAAYYQDEQNKIVPPVQEMGQGLTAYVIQNQVSLYLTKEKREKLIQAGEIPEYNWKAKVWLGVPLQNQGDEVIGAMAVQSYTDENLYDENDLKILEFVSDQVAIAIERKKAEDLLRKSEEKVRAFMNSATDSMTI